MVLNREMIDHIVRNNMKLEEWTIEKSGKRSNFGRTKFTSDLTIIRATKLRRE